MRNKLVLFIFFIVLAVITVLPATCLPEEYTVTVIIEKVEIIEDRDLGAAEIYLKATVNDREPRYSAIKGDVNDGDVLIFNSVVIDAEKLVNFTLRVEVWESDFFYSETENDFLGYVQYTRDPVNNTSQWYDAIGSVGGNNILQARVFITETVTPVNHPPVVSLINPLPGDILSGNVTIQWTASDPDNHSLKFSLSYWDGSKWKTIVTGLTGTSYVWDTVQVPDGIDYKLQIAANDGSLTAVNQTNGVFSIDNPSPPTITINYPGGWNKIKGIVPINWTASDPDNDSLTFSIYYSSDSGITWTVLAMNMTGTSYEWDTATVSNGEDYALKVEATDGTFYVSDTKESITIDNGLFGIPGFSSLLALLSLIPIYLKKRMK
ncbi:MAG: hypothetical protein ACFFD4_27490 [Candidatus Odinarchaeota archaeon]